MSSADPHSACVFTLRRPGSQTGAYGRRSECHVRSNARGHACSVLTGRPLVPTVQPVPTHIHTEWRACRGYARDGAPEVRILRWPTCGVPEGGATIGLDLKRRAPIEHHVAWLRIPRVVQRDVQPLCRRRAHPLVEELLAAVPDVVVRAITAVAADCATVGEPVARLPVACVERVYHPIVRGDRARPRAIVAVLAKGDFTAAACGW